MWNEEANQTFEDLKKAMSMVSFLALLDFLKEFIIEMDAFEMGLV